MFQRKKRSSRVRTYAVNAAGHDGERGLARDVACDGALDPVGVEHTAPSQGGQESVGLETVRKRIIMCAVAFVMAYACLGLRLWTIAAGEETGIADRGGAIVAEAARPEITDRRGTLLATSLPMRRVEIDGRDVWDPMQTAMALKSVFPDLDVDELAGDLANGRYRTIAEDITPTQERQVFNLGLPGIRFAPGTRRFYPHGALAAHLLGHTEPGKGGVMGLEKTINSLQADRSAAHSITTSIDARVQQVVGEELAKSVATFAAEAGWGAVMDMATGEILAIANVPDFDPNNYAQYEDSARRNKAVHDAYELGSAFKVFTVASALETGTATMASTYDARGSLRIADRVIRDYHGENRVLTLEEVVRHSSNIGAARIAADLGIDRQKSYLEKLGLLSALRHELPENQRPLLPSKWGPVESATISYGHGISVTPLHLLAAFSACVGDGVYRMPTFLKATSRKGEPVFAPSTVAQMRHILRSVIVEGTASKAEAEGYAPFGKTATADKVVTGGRGYRKNARISSFVGAFPGHDPRYAILVTLDNPQPTKDTFGYATAGWTAAPLFADIVERIAPLLGVMPKSTPMDSDDVFPLAIQSPVNETSPARAAMLDFEHTQ
ncbi:MAG: penicillin-binding protein 2 [Pseudomonadota bacterium]